MIIILVLISLLASCGGSKQNRHLEKRTRSRGSALDAIRRQEAKLSDIPIPISSHPLPEYCVQSEKPDEVMLGYQVIKKNANDRSNSESIRDSFNMFPFKH